MYLISTGCISSGYNSKLSPPPPPTHPPLLFPPFCFRIVITRPRANSPPRPSSFLRVISSLTNVGPSNVTVRYGCIIIDEIESSKLSLIFKWRNAKSRRSLCHCGMMIRTLRSRNEFYLIVVHLLAQYSPIQQRSKEGNVREKTN